MNEATKRSRRAPRGAWMGFAFGALFGALFNALAVSTFEPGSRSTSANDHKLLALEKRVGMLEAVDASMVRAKGYSVVNQDDGTQLLPGWVARVYDSSHPPRRNDADQGTFVIDETRFDLALHRYHDIRNVTEASYRMNALYPVHAAGFHQIGLDLEYDGPTDADAPRCKVVLKINGHALVEQQVSFRTRGSHRSQLTGGVELPVGLHPAEARILCDYVPRKRNGLVDQGSQVRVAISRRCPGEPHLTSNRKAFLHAVNVRRRSLGAAPAPSDIPQVGQVSQIPRSMAERKPREQAPWSWSSSAHSQPVLASNSQNAGTSRRFR